MIHDVPLKMAQFDPEAAKWLIEAKDKQAKKYLGTVVSNFDLQISYACWYNSEIVVSTIINCNEI